MTEQTGTTPAERGLIEKVAIHLVLAPSHNKDRYLAAPWEVAELILVNGTPVYKTPGEPHEATFSWSTIARAHLLDEYGLAMQGLTKLGYFPYKSQAPELYGLIEAAMKFGFDGDLQIVEEVRNYQVHPIPASELFEEGLDRVAE